MVGAVINLANRVHANHRLIEKNAAEIARLNAEIATLNAELQRALEDLRLGLFCSKCDRSRTQIERETATPFDQHLREVRGTAVSATQKQFDDTARFYRDKIQAAEAKRARLQAQSDEAVDENIRAWDQLQQGLNLWRACVSLEEGLIAAHDDAARQEEKAAIALAEGRLAAGRRERARLLEQGKLTEEDQRIFESWERTWRKLIDDTKKKAEFRRSMYWASLREAARERARDYVELRNAVATAQDFAQRYDVIALTTGHPLFRALDLRDTPVAAALPGIAGMNDESMGVYFSFGKLPETPRLLKGFSAGVEARASRTEPNTEVVAFLELFGHVRIGAGWRTSYTEFGVETGPTFHVEPVPQPGVELPTENEGVSLPVLD